MILYAPQPYTRPPEQSWQRRIFCTVVYSVAVWLHGARETYVLRTLSCEVMCALYRERSKMNRLRSKGRFIKKSALEKIIKDVLCMNNAKNKAAAVTTSEAESKRKHQQCIGRRIVEVSELAKNLKCCRCKQVLSLEDIVGEKRLGLNSILSVHCQNCFVQTKVHTGKMHCRKRKTDLELSDVNTKAVLGKFVGQIGYNHILRRIFNQLIRNLLIRTLYKIKFTIGAVHAGMGCTALNKLLACLNIPTISGDLFKRYEREVGCAIEVAARESCKWAAAEERRLVIENVGKLCEEL